MNTIYKIYVKNIKTNEISDVRYLKDTDERDEYVKYLKFVYRFHKNKTYSIMIDEYVFNVKEIRPIITINN